MNSDFLLPDTCLRMYDVQRVTIEPVKVVKNSGYTTRWQDIRIATADGREHIITLFLNRDVEGLTAAQPESPQRRLDDLPRQPLLHSDDGSEGGLTD